jgi:hypothetical protein
MAQTLRNGAESSNDIRQSLAKDSMSDPTRVSVGCSGLDLGALQSRLREECKRSERFQGRIGLWSRAYNS